MTLRNNDSVYPHDNIGSPVPGITMRDHVALQVLCAMVTRYGLSLEPTTKTLVDDAFDLAEMFITEANNR
jgi:hypothetical protein